MNDSQRIEQAVFTSAVTDRAAGYQVVAASPGVAEEDLRELAVWGPSHDALLVSTPGAASINFHPLPSGAFCVSRTTASGWEYSGRGGARVYTQNLVVPPPILERFANNPFALMRAALAGGSIRVHEEVPPRLTAFRLPGRGSAVDAGLLSRLAACPGPDWMAAMVQAALRCKTLAVAGGPPAEHILAGVINALPPDCRTAFSFSTGLKYSSRRPFRMVALSEDVDEQHRVERLYDVTMLRLEGDVPAEWAAADTWPRLIQRALKLGRTSLLASELSKRHLDVSLDDLSALGLELLEELEASALESLPPTSGDMPACATAAEGSGPVCPAAAQPRPAPEMAQSHGAHARFEKTLATAPSAIAAKLPSSMLEGASPAARRRLGQLDHLVHEAVCGRLESLEQLKTMWPKLQKELGDALVARSREAYLRYALAVWDECLDGEQVRNPALAVQTLDALCVLFDE